MNYNIYLKTYLLTPLSTPHLCMGRTRVTGKAMANNDRHQGAGRVTEQTRHNMSRR